MKRKNKKVLSTFLATSMVVSMGVSNTSPVFAGGDTLPPREGEQGYLGENQPVYHGHRAMDVLNWSPETDEYSDFMRADVPLQERNEAFTATQANPKLDQAVKSLSLTEDYGNEFFNPYNYNDDFSQYLFNFWQYLDYRASWHGTVTNPTPNSLFNPEAGWWERDYEFGLINIPNPAYTNAAHKNGVQSLGCIFFPRSEHTDDLVFKDETGRFPAADKLVEMAKWYGFDGYFINAEETLPADFMPVYEEFCRQMTEQGIYIQTYASNLYGENNKDSWGRINYYTKDATDFSNWVKGPDDETIASNSLYMNPGPSVEQVDGSVKVMEDLGLDAKETVFQTLEAGQTGFSGVRGSLNNILDENLVPRTGIANLGAGTVWAHLDEQLFGHTGNNSYSENRRGNPDYQKYVFARERTWWTGSQNQPYYANDDSYIVPGVSFKDKNTTKYTEEEREELLQAVLDADTNAYTTANDPTRGEYDGHSPSHGDFQSWPGMAAFISERSVINGTDFVTNFNTGHGMQYFVDGEVSNDSQWSNINDQDILPTWQWWYETADDSEATLNFDFDYGKEYNPAFELNQVGGYDGGSSLVAKGSLNAEHFLHLYKTKMDINENSELSITYMKSTPTDESEMKVGLIFEDAPDKVEYITVKGSDEQSDDWKTEAFDLSKYEGRTLAAFGLAFDPNGEKIEDYQMNIGEISISDDKNAPAAPTGLNVDAAFNTGEVYLSWDLEDYDTVQKYNVYAVMKDGTEKCLGGIYDDQFYVKDVYDNENITGFKVTAEGANGVESKAAEVAYSLNKGATDLAVTSEDGALKATWKNPELKGCESIRADVTLPYNYAGNDSTYSAEFEKGATSGTVEVPLTDGSDYNLRLSYLDKDGKVLAYTDVTGKLADTYCDPYKGEISKSIVPGKGWKLQNPLVYDWWHLSARDADGNMLKENVIRGKDDLTGLKLTADSGYIEVQLEDFNGNKTDWTRVYYGGAKPPVVEHTITVNVNDEAMGTVTMDSETGVYVEGTNATLKAEPKEGYTFVNWTINGEEVSTENPYVHTVEADAAITANFAAKEGWNDTENGWEYYENGQKVVGWKGISGTWYYFNESGIMETGWVSVGGHWYYLNNSGAMCTGWVSVNGHWYYMDQWGAMCTGWISVNDHWYYMDQWGAMCTGWVSVNGHWYYMDQWGAMCTGWVLVGDTWYYMNADGSMATGWVSVGGHWYYLNNSGAMETGWALVGSDWYYLNADGTMASNQWIDGYYVDASGKMA